MADNVETNAGTGGAVVASDDIAGVQFQRVKIVVGADGVNDGDVASGNPLPVAQATAASLNAEVQGDVAHDAPAAGNPVLLGAYAKAAAPTDVSADADAVRLWALRNGALAVNLTAAGALMPGDATNGLDVDITRLPALVAGTANIGDVDVLTVPAPLSTTGGGTEATALRVTLANDSTGIVRDSTAVVDNGGGFADGTSRVLPAGYLFDEVAGTALTENDIGAARINANRAQVGVLEDGATRARYATVTASNALKVDGSAVTQPVSGTVTASNAAGDIAHDAADSGNPVKVGFKAINALPTAVANSDRANGICDLFGRQLVSHIDSAQHITKVFNATTTQTGTDVWTPTSGKRIAVTSVVVGAYGTTAGRLILWFGDNADTTYTAGTDQVLLAASFAPSATSKPGLVFTPAFPVFCLTADRELHCTTDAGISIDVVVHGYEF